MKVQTEARRKHFIDKYPVLARILKKFRKDNQQIHIGVQRVDAQMLFDHGARFARANHGYMYIHDSNTDEKFTCEQFISYYVVEHNDTIVARFTKRENGPVILCSQKCNLNEVRYFVKAECVNYHYFDNTQEDNYGDYIRSELEITVYGLPKGESLKNLIDNVDFCQSGVRLNHRHILVGLLENIPVYEKLNDQIGYLADRFAANCFASGMRQVLDEANCALSGELGGVKVHALETAGRMLFTLENDESQITFIADGTAEDHVNLGMQSMDATYAQAKDLVDEVVKYWRGYFMHRKYTDDSCPLQPSDSVSIL